MSQIDISSIRLNVTVPAWTRPSAVGGHDGDDIPKLMVKFGRAAVQDALGPGDEVDVTVSGELIDGTRFEGSDTISVIHRPGRQHY